MRVKRALSPQTEQFTWHSNPGGALTPSKPSLATPIFRDNALHIIVVVVVVVVVVVAVVVK